MPSLAVRRAVAIVLTAAGCCCLALHVPAHADERDEIDKMQKELVELTQKVDELYRRVPFCDPAEEERAVRLWAEKGGELVSPEIKSAGSERLLFADGTPTPVQLNRLEVSGRDPYSKVHLFLIRMGLRNRLIDLERLHLEAEAGTTVSYTARLALPCYSEPQPEKAAKETPPLSLHDFVAQTLARQRTMFEKVTELTTRSKPARFAEALAAFDGATRGRGVALTEVRLAEEAVLEGVVAGASGPAGLKPTLEKAGFRVTGMQMSPAGACHKFAVTARPEEREPLEEPDVVIWNGLFDDQTAAFCELAPSAGRVVVRGKTPVPEGDALALHLRDVNLVDAFFILHDLTAANFVIDADVKGRVSVDVEGAGLEETLAAMSAAGVIVGPGPLRRVSRAGNEAAAPASPRPGYTGEPIDVSVHDTDLGTFLCTLGQISERRVWSLADLKSRFNMFVKDVPWDQVLDGLAASAGLVAVLDEDRLLVGPGPAEKLPSLPGLVPYCKPPVDSIEELGSIPRLEGSPVPLPRLAAAELELAGLVRAGDAWKAYVYTPSRRLMLLATDQQLLDARVTSVGSGEVVLAKAGSEALNVALRP
ncbi:MAG TPA: hypothetical protein VGX68_16765 [Thermoanaerobaculia bacterium]|jgi:hypothetical protein|nr:hypothetical protein [Thermoanaerobaculia bacterium]